MRRQIVPIASSSRSRATAGSILLLALCLPLSGCVSPTIQIVDRRTALENQILGTWHELDGQMQLIASVRGEGEGMAVKSFQARALAARRKMIFFQDEVDELKDYGCLGEGKDGLLAVRDCEHGKHRGVTPPEQLAAMINGARLVLFDYVLRTSPNLSERDLSELRRAFARMKRKQARAGHWLQAEDGSWYRKD
ncbi:MAG: DUF1318 domain-containing protein [Deltaproteobacteria bacterium]|nr:MAG: DUF1318 domain-containing protein [Deltaproteobacteria bacterium]